MKEKKQQQIQFILQKFVAIHSLHIFDLLINFYLLSFLGWYWFFFLAGVRPFASSCQPLVMVHMFYGIQWFFFHCWYVGGKVRSRNKRNTFVKNQRKNKIKKFSTKWNKQQKWKIKKMKKQGKIVDRSVDIHTSHKMNENVP